ncbi:MAG: ABC transporter permease [Bdellovibrionales bacterium]
MKNILSHFKHKVLELIRQPMHMISTMVFPSIFFLFFARPNIDSVEGANLMLGSFASYAFLGVVFFQFGVDIAGERSNSWFLYLNTLKIKAHEILVARILSTILLALLAQLTLIAIVFVTTEANISMIQILNMSLFLSLGSIPFAFLGLIVGFSLQPKSALPISNLIYLCGAFVGGMWMPPAVLPETVEKISVYLPTRHFAEIAWSITLKQSYPVNYAYSLMLFTLVFGAIAYLIYQKKTLNQRL